MSTDPYLLYKSEVEGALQTASGLHSSYRRILATLPPSKHSSSEELSWARDELRGTLSALESDTEELSMSVDVVAEAPERFGLSYEEVERRRAFVRRVEAEIANIRRDVSPPSAAKSRSPRPLSTARMPESSSSHIQLPASPPPGRSSHDGDDDYDRSYATQQQSLLIEDQDRLLDGISGTVSTLRQQAGIMGTEILSQVGLLTDLESGVDRSQSRLDRANRRLEEFVRKNKNSKSSWTIFFLIIILSILLLMIVLI